MFNSANVNCVVVSYLQMGITSVVTQCIKNYIYLFKLICSLCCIQERHAALEKMGISVQTSGIKVEQGKHYLVNLNADPSLNELLVYYLKVPIVHLDFIIAHADS